MDVKLVKNVVNDTVSFDKRMNVGGFKKKNIYFFDLAANLI